MTRAVVAQFIKSAGGRLELWNVTVVESKTSPDGKVYCGRTYYDVDISRRYGYIFHQSGSAGGDKPVDVDGIYFVSGAPRVREKPNLLCCWPRDETGRRTRAIRKRNRTRHLLSLPKYFDLRPGEDFLAWLERNGIQQDAVFCAECKDYFPEDSTCQHVWWCDKISWWSTPQERCGHAGGEECYA